MGWLEEYGGKVGREWIGWIDNGMACIILGITDEEEFLLIQT